MAQYEIRRYTEKFVDIFKDNLKSKIAIEENVVIVETIKMNELATVLALGKGTIASLNDQLELVGDDIPKLERSIIPCPVGPILVIYEFS